MSFKLEDLKEKLEAADYAALEAHLSELAGQRDEARRESIDGRKKLKARVQELEEAQTTLFEKLGVESVEDVENLPDGKGQAEAVKQHEARIKRLEKQLADTEAAKREVESKHRASMQSAALAKALSKHEFTDHDVVEHFVASRLVWEGDDLFYRADGGGLVSLDDGVSEFAKTRTGLLKQQGAGGSGYNQNAGSGKDKAWDDMTLTERGALFKANPERYRQLKAQATA